jgi:hypothetical protein
MGRFSRVVVMFFVCSQSFAAEGGLGEDLTAHLQERLQKIEDEVQSLEAKVANGLTVVEFDTEFNKLSIKQCALLDAVKGVNVGLYMVRQEILKGAKGSPLGRNVQTAEVTGPEDSLPAYHSSPRSDKKRKNRQP